MYSLPYFNTWCSVSATLECRCEACCTWLAENTGCKKWPKIRHLGTIAQLCRAISSQLRHVSTIGKKLVKQQYFLHMSSQYGKLRPSSGWDCFVSLGTPINFNGFRVWACSVTARYSSIGRQPNVAALNRGRHLYSAGRSSRWALAHISSFVYIAITITVYLWPPCVADADIIFCHFSFFFLLFPRLISAATDWMSTILIHMVWF